MWRSAKEFWEICLLRKGPQDLPASTSLLALAAITYIAVDLLILALQMPASQIFPAALVETALTAALTGILLWARNYSNRFVQTLTALFGIGTLLTLAALPLLVWQLKIATPDDLALTTPGVVLLCVMVWNVAVVGHILRHALSTLYVLGVGLALLYAYIVFNVLRALFDIKG